MFILLPVPFLTHSHSVAAVSGVLGTFWVDRWLRALNIQLCGACWGWASHLPAVGHLLLGTAGCLVTLARIGLFDCGYDSRRIVCVAAQDVAGCDSCVGDRGELERRGKHHGRC